MVNKDFIKSYSLKTTKNGLKIPVVNGVHLHSAYDPEREAVSFIEGQKKQITPKNDFLVLGLGFGYHVRELIGVCRNLHKPFKIVVIEPNEQVARDCIEQGLINENEVYICSSISAQEFYQNKDLIHFLLKKPAIINHSASFNLYQDYFRELLSYEADQVTERSIECVELPKLKEYLLTLDQEKTVWQNVEAVSRKQVFSSEMDFLLMAFKSMTEKSMVMNEEKR